MGFSAYPEGDERTVMPGRAMNIFARIWRAAMRGGGPEREEAPIPPPLPAPQIVPLPAASPIERPMLFQYWNTSQRPASVEPLMAGWAADPGFDYRSFTRDAALEMIRARLDQRTATAFARCLVPAMQADLFRLCALFVFGGIYVDADIENLGDNAFLRHHEGRGFLFLRRGNLANDIMVVHAPGDATIRFALDRALDNIEQNRGENVWQMTGPGILTGEYNRRGPADPLFAGFRIGDVVDVRKHVGFHWNLDYKTTDADWRTATTLVAPQA